MSDLGPAEPPADTGDEPFADRPLLDKFEHALTQLEQSGRFGRARHRHAVLEIGRRVLAAPGGLDVALARAPRLDAAGVFADTDWDDPSVLLPSLVRGTFEAGSRETVTLELLSELRLLAVVEGAHAHPGLAPDQARHHLTQVLALNLDRLFGAASEATRLRDDGLGPAIDALLERLASRIGYGDVLEHLVDEIWRVLAQRPIQVGPIKAMVARIAVSLSEHGAELTGARLGADRLISALFGPTQGCRDDPGLDAYRERLASMDRAALEQEASGFARAVHDVGLVSDYHPVFLNWLLDNDHATLVAPALGLSSTGLDVLRSYQPLVHALIREALHVETAQSVYGLAMLLERGILYMPPIAPALWRQLALPLADGVRTRLTTAFGSDVPPRVRLLAGVLSLLGQPLGIGQGNNPTCQSARALSMWSYSAPDYLLDVVATAAGTDALRMHFEGQAIASDELPSTGLAAPIDTDAVSIVAVPHLDRIYRRMGELCVGRGEDPHRWINPELHGWWVGRDFMIAVDVATGALRDFDAFIARFYESYHPYHNGNQPLIHPQPAGVAVTDSTGAFVGWHAITLLRVALDQDDAMRVYFFNPNNDSGQDWGDGVVVSTSGHGERFGEASLPFDQMLSRLYIYHDDPAPRAPSTPVSGDEIAAVRRQALSTWAADRRPPGHQAADPGVGA